LIAIVVSIGGGAYNTKLSATITGSGAPREGLAASIVIALLLRFFQIGGSEALLTQGRAGFRVVSEGFKVFTTTGWIGLHATRNSCSGLYTIRAGIPSNSGTTSGAVPGALSRYTTNITMVGDSMGFQNVDSGTTISFLHTASQIWLRTVHTPWSTTISSHLAAFWAVPSAVKVGLMSADISMISNRVFLKNV